MSCLFDSLAIFIFEDAQKIRERICDYLEENNPLIEGMKTSDILKLESDEYLLEMRKAKTWGGAIEIQVACNIWSIRVNVNTHASKKIEFLPFNGMYIKTIGLRWTGNHYEAISSTNPNFKQVSADQ